MIDKLLSRRGGGVWCRGARCGGVRQVTRAIFGRCLDDFKQPPVTPNAVEEEPWRSSAFINAREFIVDTVEGAQPARSRHQQKQVLPVVIFYRLLEVKIQGMHKNCVVAEPRLVFASRFIKGNQATEAAHE